MASSGPCRGSGWILRAGSGEESREDGAAVLGGIMESAGIKSMENEAREKVIDAASGLTTIEAENAFALSVVENKNIEPAIVTREKAQAVKKNGILEIIETKESLESIGGLDVLKEWLLKRRHAFSQRAIDYGLPTPKGLLIIGIPLNDGDLAET